MQSLSALLGEADVLIQSKVASGMSKTASACPETDDDIFKLADMVRHPAQEAIKEAAAPTDDEEFTLTEKIAHAAALIDVWNNLPTILRIDEFEKAAKARGYTDDQITDYIEKNAAQFQVRSVLDK
jgi:hypothetical protein